MKLFTITYTDKNGDKVRLNNLTDREIAAIANREKPIDLKIMYQDKKLEGGDGMEKTAKISIYNVKMKHYDYDEDFDNSTIEMAIQDRLWETFKKNYADFAKESRGAYIICLWCIRSKAVEVFPVVSKDAGEGLKTILISKVREMILENPRYSFFYSEGVKQYKVV